LRALNLELFALPSNSDFLRVHQGLNQGNFVVSDPASSDFDVCVVGHVTMDIVRLGRAKRLVPGGTAYYTAMALKKLGLKVAVVTKGAAQDRERLLHELTINKVAVCWKEGKTTAVFENTYGRENPDRRSQQIKALGTAFLPEDVEGISARSFHLGPLTRQDIPFQLLKQLAGRAEVVSLDVQGMLRPSLVGVVTHEQWAEMQQWFEYVDILKANKKEALILSGEQDVERAAAVLASLSPREVIITLGSRGSLIHTHGRLHKIPAWIPRKTADPTGCGDTYMGGYLYERLKGTAPDMAGRFAAAVATLKLEGYGPFGGDVADVRALLSRE
jgi:sugar/nucleoside kinase (ribokinase family)